MAHPKQNGGCKCQVQLQRHLVALSPSVQPAYPLRILVKNTYIYISIYIHLHRGLH